MVLLSIIILPALAIPAPYPKSTLLEFFIVELLINMFPLLYIAPPEEKSPESDTAVLLSKTELIILSMTQTVKLY